ncbi:hypothetical protein AWENTII_011255 [Aspergillus wentii]
MEHRIRWLESLVRENCPNVDLSQGPGNERQLDDRAPTGTPGDHIGVESAAQSPHPEPRGHVDDENTTSQQLRDQPIAPVTTRAVHDEPQQAHEIGLVSLSSGGDPRYIGPSSGYFFANRIFFSVGRRSNQSIATANISGSTSLSAELLNMPASLPRKESAVELSTRYFQSIHFMYPFLHEPSHMETIDRVYTSREENPSDIFQVFMVLAVAALNLSRQCKVHLPVEGYYTAAMKYVDHICGDTSMAGLQSLLLLMVYALHNPSCSLNIWNLNYQCLASLIDLGLQRDVRASPSFQISVLDQEMRTRVFWVAYTFDRAICTMMGRPIGVRDEACDLRFPMDISDRNLVNPDNAQRVEQESSSHLSHSIHLFKLARMNSEIKYIMHSISRDTPAYAYPPVMDIFAWQQDMIHSLQDWLSKIPRPVDNGDDKMVRLCKIKYHETMILLLRPSPGISTPSDQTLDICFHQAVDLIRGLGELYRSGNLLYSRLVVHSIFLSTLVMLHCIWKLPETAAKCQVDELVSDINISQNILSSIGEYWTEANRARDCIGELSSVTIQRLLKSDPTVGLRSSPIQVNRRPRISDSRGPEMVGNYRAHFQDQRDIAQENNSIGVEGSNAHLIYPIQSQDDTGVSYGPVNLFDDFLQGGFQGWSGMSDIDGLMWEFFH